MKRLFMLNKIVDYTRGFLTFFKRNISLKKDCCFNNKKHIKLCGNNKIYQGVTIEASGRNSFSLGKGSNIHRYSILLSAGGKIDIGENTNIGDFCFLSGQGGLTIGNNVLITSYVKIIPNSHNYTDITTPICQQPCSAKGIKIGDDCWIGMGAVILDGVTIGKHCVVGAGSIVVKDIEDYTVVAGVPAKPIKFYNSETKEWQRCN